MPELYAPQTDAADVRRSETQGLLILTSTPAGDEGLIGKPLIAVGALAVEGTYSCMIHTHDWSALEVILKPSAVTGSVTPQLRRMYMGGQAVRSSTAGAACVAGTTDVITASAVVGTQRFRVDIPVPAAGSITFAPGSDPTSPAALAEFNGA